MTMEYGAFLARIINDGIAAASEDYKDDEEKREGAVGGFLACRGLQPGELAELLREANQAASTAMMEDSPRYWRLRCYALEVEWVCNCVSAVLMNEKQPVIVQPTCRGVMKAAEILGVRGATN